MAAKTLCFETKEKIEFIDITAEIEKTVKEAKIKDGVCNVFVLHTSCALTINENEPNLKKDYLKFVKKLTAGETWAHDQLDQNAEAHLVATLLGQHKTLFVVDNKLMLGQWQRLFLVELDGPRQRNLMVIFGANGK